VGSRVGTVTCPLPAGDACQDTDRERALLHQEHVFVQGKYIIRSAYGSPEILLQYYHGTLYQKTFLRSLRRQGLTTALLSVASFDMDDLY
jgi:hypothetical protein